MTIVLASLLALLGQAPQAVAADYSPEEFSAGRQDPKAFTLDPASVRITALGGDIGTTDPAPPPAGLPQDPLVIIDHILNIFSKVWKIIDDNKPVVDIKTTFAAAIPEGITHWSQLEKWSRPEGTRYLISAKNMYGTDVVKVRYQVLRVHGGSYKGKGHYLSGVTVIPESVDVSWGYRLSLDADVPSVSNVGTSEDPMASMIAQLKWKISTVVKASEGTAVYYLEGDGTFREIGGPFQKNFSEKVPQGLSGLRPPAPLPVSVR